MAKLDMYKVCSIIVASVFLKLSKSDLQHKLNCLTEIYEDDVDASEFWVIVLI